jgi:hypothetical protein
MGFDEGRVPNCWLLAAELRATGNGDFFQIEPILPGLAIGDGSFTLSRDVQPCPAMSREDAIDETKPILLQAVALKRFARPA